MHGGSEQVVGHVHQHAAVARSVFTQGRDNRLAYQPGVARLAQVIAQAFAQFFRWTRLVTQTATDTAGYGQQIVMLEFSHEPVVATQDNAQKTARIKPVTGKHTKLAQQRRAHRLCLINEQDGAIEA